MMTEGVSDSASPPARALPEGTEPGPARGGREDGPGEARASSLPSSLGFASTALCVGLLILGTFWRFVDLDYPPTFSFNEHHFISNARNYMAGRADWNDHPPLGKLVLIPAMKVLGDRGLGWRLSSALAGLAIVVLSGLIAARIFRARTVGLLTAAFVAADGFFISYARTALIDNPLTVWVYAALALMLYARSLAWFAWAAVAIGLAVSTKWTGACVVLLAPIMLIRQRRSALHVAWMFALASLVYLAISAAALLITHQPISPAGMMRSNWHLLRHHAGFTVWDNSASSRWYTWPFLARPIVMHFARVGDAVRATSTLGNLLLWFGTTAALAAALAGLARSLWRKLRARTSVATAHCREALVIASMVALTLPFIVSNRQSYIFHYLGAYGLGLGLLASRVAAMGQRRPWVTLGFLLGVAGVSLLYVPLWTGAAITQRGFDLRLPFPGWR